MKFGHGFLKHNFILVYLLFTSYFFLKKPFNSNIFIVFQYDPKFGDAFWNSSKYSMLQYLYMMMTSWAIVCDVWYLPPMYQEETETAIDFANRVKAVISKQGGLVDLMWLVDVCFI